MDLNLPGLYDIVNHQYICNLARSLLRAIEVRPNTKGELNDTRHIGFIGEV